MNRTKLHGTNCKIKPIRGRRQVDSTSNSTTCPVASDATYSNSTGQVPTYFVCGARGALFIRIASLRVNDSAQAKIPRLLM